MTQINSAPEIRQAHPAHSPLLIAGRLCNPAIAELADLDAWVCWRRVRHNSRWQKRPCTPAGSNASTTDPRSWSSFDECWAAAFVRGFRQASGIGRVLVGDGLVGIDLDRAIAVDGQLETWAQKIVQRVASYWEISPSGTGLHSWCRALWPSAGNKSGTVEVYSRKRFLTVTGAHLEGTPDHIACVNLEFLVEYSSELNGGYRDQPRELLPCTFAPRPPMPAHLIAGLARSHPQLRRIIEADYETASQRGLALCRFAHRAGWPPDAAWALVTGVRKQLKVLGRRHGSLYPGYTFARVGY